MRLASYVSRHLFALCLVPSIALLAGCGVRGSGVMATETRNVSGFSEVALSGSGVVNASDELDVAISGSGSVEVVGKPYVEQRISGSGRVSRWKPG